MQTLAGKYLTFALDQEDYGIPIRFVREIMGMMDITQVPKMPSFVRGVINLRGKIISVMDLRERFSMIPKNYHDRTCIIVLEYATNHGRHQSGIIVDSVSEVLYLGDESIEKCRSTGADKEDSCIDGMGKIKEKVVLLLDVEKLVFSEQQMQL